MSDFANMIVWRLAYATCLVAVAGAFVWLATRKQSAISPRFLGICHWFVLAQGLFIIPVGISLTIPVAKSGLVQRFTIADVFPAAFADVGRSDAPIRSEPYQPSSAKGSPILPTPARSLPNHPSIASCLFGVWLAGMAFVALRLVKSYCQLVRTVNLRECVDPSWVKQWSELQTNAGVARPIPLYESEGFGPALCWWPDGYRLIVPSDLCRQLTHAQRTGIFLHELAHYRRFDVVRLLVSNLLAAVHWFNPIVWWSVRQIAVAAEWAADDAVKSEQGSVATVFARVLLEIGRSNPRAFTIIAPVAAGSLSTRIRRLTSPSLSREPVVKKLCLILTLIVVVALGTFRIELSAQEAENANVSVPSRSDSDDEESETKDPAPSRTNDATPEDKQTPSRRSDTHITQLICAVEFAHKVISNKEIIVRNPSLELGSRVFSDLQPDRNRFLNDELYKFLVSQGFISSHRIVANESSWLFADGHAKYCFNVNYDLLLPDAKRFVNAVAGDDIFEDVLDNVQYDPQGPRIDVRRDLIKRLGEEVIVIADTAANTPSGNALLFAFAIEDEEALGRILQQAALSDPSASKVDENGVTIRVFSSGATATCVAGRRLLYGDIRLVQSAVRRFKEQAPSAN